MTIKGKFFKATVTMKTGFKYSFVCLGIHLQSRLKASDGFWTESMTYEEITEEEYTDFYQKENIENAKPLKKNKKNK